MWIREYLRTASATDGLNSLRCPLRVWGGEGVRLLCALVSVVGETLLADKVSVRKFNAKRTPPPLVLLGAYLVKSTSRQQHIFVASGLGKSAGKEIENSSNIASA